ncbi:unnamed protein product [Psylliodes chrysocephalus]|uniref:Uncharacterized protein n=1 Tax=Psylliodes chrysocephalus TaxID=3402493 RepID=A0A9P0CEA5_9CUCU|nr:unnamed protein product [Psylliodes chrysocephala]
MKNQNFLRKILKLKNELFGQFSTTITKESRKTAWINVRDYAVSIGLIGSDKEFCYVRDVTWPNLRSRTMTKIDQSNKTGAQGGPESKLDDTDKLVIEIIGNESPVVQGIGVPDLMETVSEVKEITEDFSYSMPNENDDNGTTKSKCSLQQSSCRGKKRVIVQLPDNAKNIQSLKIKKLQLEVRKLELEVREKECSFCSYY